MEEISGSLLPAIIASCPKEAYSLAEITLFAALSETAWNQDISREHMEDLLRRGSSILSTLKGLDWTCTVFISHGMYHLAFSKGTVPIQFDLSLIHIYLFPRLLLTDFFHGFSIKMKRI